MINMAGAGDNVDMEEAVHSGEKCESAASVPIRSQVKESKQKYDFPNTMEGFKYFFNERGQMRHIETQEEFVFKLKDEHIYNQKRYEALGEIITEKVYTLLETEACLKRIYVPVDSSEEEPRSFFFMSDDAMTNPEKLLVLIHGSGVVRAGQWARRLIMNDCLDSGTQLPFIKRAVKAGFGVVVLNTNLNYVKKGDTEVPIPNNSSPEEHANYVWDNFISKAAAKHIAIIAHSYGGVVTTNLAIQHEVEFILRVFAIAFTDSVHSLQHQEAPESLFKFYEETACNWVSSEEPLDTPISSFRRDCPLVSAGHPKHENTSWSSFLSIFTFLGKQYAKVTQTAHVTQTAQSDAAKEDL